MPGLKHMVFATLTTGALACLPVSPATAAGPLFLAPWALGHVVLPLIAETILAATQPRAPYPSAQGYYSGSPGYYAQPNFYPRPPVNYAAAPGFYPQPYYRAPYASPMPRPYSQARGYYPQRPSYYGSYGGQGAYRAGGSGYRHW